MRNRASSSVRHWRSSRWHAAARVACWSRGALSIWMDSSKREARRTRCARVMRRQRPCGASSPLWNWGSPSWIAAEGTGEAPRAAASRVSATEGPVIEPLATELLAKLMSGTKSSA